MSVYTVLTLGCFLKLIFSYIFDRTVNSYTLQFSHVKRRCITNVYYVGTVKEEKSPSKRRPCNTSVGTGIFRTELPGTCALAVKELNLSWNLS
jgi:hypothetical protein